MPLNPGQFPPFPTILSGAVTVGGAPAPDGTAIYAQVGYWRSDTVTTSGGRYVGIVVRPVDWSLHLKSITFHSGGVQAQETAVFNGGILQTETLGLTFPAPLPQ